MPNKYCLFVSVAAHSLAALTLVAMSDDNPTIREIGEDVVLVEVTPPVPLEEVSSEPPAQSDETATIPPVPIDVSSSLGTIDYAAAPRSQAQPTPQEPESSPSVDSVTESSLPLPDSTSSKTADVAMGTADADGLQTPAYAISNLSQELVDQLTASGDACLVVFTDGEQFVLEHARSHEIRLCKLGQSPWKDIVATRMLPLPQSMVQLLTKRLKSEFGFSDALRVRLAFHQRFDAEILARQNAALNHAAIERPATVMTNGQIEWAGPRPVFKVTDIKRL